MRIFTTVERQFWRESEQAWVDNVNIHRDECAILGGTDPKKWRHRVITTSVETGEWSGGQRPKRKP